MSLNATSPQRRRARSAPPSALGGPSESGQSGHQIVLTTATFEHGHENAEGITIQREWKIIRHDDSENHAKLGQVFVESTTTAGDVVKYTPEALIVLAYVFDLSLSQGSAPNETSGAISAAVGASSTILACDSNPNLCAMCTLVRDFPHLVPYVPCLQHLQRGICKHECCQFKHVSQEEMGGDKAECKVWKITRYCRFRCPQPQPEGLKMKPCKKGHSEDVEPTYLPPMTHKVMPSVEMYNEVMALVTQFDRRMRVGENAL